MKLSPAVRVARSRAEPLRIVVGATRVKKWTATVASCEQAGVPAVLEVVDGAGSPEAVSADLVVVAGDALVRTTASRVLTCVYAPPDMGRTVDDVLRDLVPTSAGAAEEQSGSAETSTGTGQAGTTTTGSLASSHE